MSLTNDLVQWRKIRNITKPNTHVYVENMLEELLEIFYVDKAMIETIKHDIFRQYFKFKNPISEINTIDSIQDCQVFSINETELMGYDNEKCNTEVYKHISYRRQCPEQRDKWLENGVGEGEKWRKDLSQPKEEIYEPQYGECKL